MPRQAKRYADIFTKEMIQFYLSHPCEFVEDIIFGNASVKKGGTLFLSEQQKQVLNALITSKRISVRSGRGIGKTSLDSFIIIWFLCTRADPKIIVTAPTAKQLNNQLWPEVAKWLKLSIVRDLFVWTNRRVYLRETPSTWFAASVTSDTPEGIQGSHSKHMLLVADEASGISDTIFDTLLGSMTEDDNICLLSGNPTRTSGLFFDSHNKARSQWTCFHFSSEDSPFVTEEFIKEFEIRYGKNHLLYKVHVLGEFPSGSPESFIPLELVLQASMRDVVADGEVQIGVDVAHMGDDLTALAWRRGNKVYPIITKAQTSIPDTVGLVLNLVKEIRAKTGYKHSIKVCVDASGVGAGVADDLALDRQNNIEVVPVNFGSTSPQDQYMYMCSYLWGNFRDKINYIELPDNDETLYAELSNRRYKITPTGKTRIEPKDEYKKDFGKSPDKADAIILAFAGVENESRVLKDFDYLDPSIVCDLHQIGYNTSGEKFCSVYQNKNREFAILFCTWVGSKLVINSECFSDDVVINLVREIQRKGQFKRIIGNEVMFGEYGEDVSSQFTKYGLPIYENYRYDEYGAIEALNILIKGKRINIDKGCSKLITQMRKWNFNKNRGSVEVEYIGCYCLLNIISELKERIIPQTYERPVLPYTGQHEGLIRGVGKIRKKSYNSWQGA